MKKTSFEQLIRKMKQVPPGLPNKEAIRSRLLTYMRMHPIELSTPVRWTHYSQEVRRQFSWSAFRQMRYSYLPVTLSIAIVLSGGLSAAAESALPGGVLYPIKTSINEEVVSLVTVKTESKAKWEGRRAERRLEEATSLAMKGELTPARQVVIERKLKQHTDKTSEHIEELKQEDKVTAVAVSTEVETKLRSQEQELSAVAETTGDQSAVAVAQAAEAQVATIAENKEAIVKEAIVETITAATTTPVASATSTDITVSIMATTTATTTDKSATTTEKQATSTGPFIRNELPIDLPQLGPDAQRAIQKKVLESLSTGSLDIQLGF